MRRSRQWLAVAATLLVTSVTAALVLHQLQDTPASPVSAPYTDSPERREYQSVIDASPDRFEPGFELVIIDGLFWIRTDNGPSSRVPCKVGCATITNGAVSLPVGYIHGLNVAPEPAKFAPISSLTYWNPILHKQETIQPVAGLASVVLPASLVEARDLASLQIGETTYTTTDFVRRTPQGTIFIFNVKVFSEESLYGYGRYVRQAAVKKSESGICVIMPENIQMQPVAAEDVGLYASDHKWTQVTDC